MIQHGLSPLADTNKTWTFRTPLGVCVVVEVEQSRGRPMEGCGFLRVKGQLLPPCLQVFSPRISPSQSEVCRFVCVCVCLKAYVMVSELLWVIRQDPHTPVNLGEPGKHRITIKIQIIRWEQSSLSVTTQNLRFITLYYLALWKWAYFCGYTSMFEGKLQMYF